MYHTIASLFSFLFSQVYFGSTPQLLLTSSTDDLCIPYVYYDRSGCMSAICQQADRKSTLPQWHQSLSKCWMAFSWFAGRSFFLVAYVALFSTEKHYRLSRETSDDNNTSSTCRRCFSTLSIWKEMCIIDSRGVINPLTLILIRHFMHICFLSSKTPEQLFSNLTEIWERIHLKWSSQLVLVAFEPTWLIVHRRWSTLPFANCMLLDDSLKSQVKSGALVFLSFLVFHCIDLSAALNVTTDLYLVGFTDHFDAFYSSSLISSTSFSCFFMWICFLPFKRFFSRTLSLTHRLCWPVKRSTTRHCLR